jgi:hypothetical protein
MAATSTNTSVRMFPVDKAPLHAAPADIPSLGRRDRHLASLAPPQTEKETSAAPNGTLKANSGVKAPMAKAVKIRDSGRGRSVRARSEKSRDATSDRLRSIGQDSSHAGFEATQIRQNGGIQRHGSRPQRFVDAWAPRSDACPWIRGGASDGSLNRRHWHMVGALAVQGPAPASGDVERHQGPSIQKPSACRANAAVDAAHGVAGHAGASADGL